MTSIFSGWFSSGQAPEPLEPGVYHMKASPGSSIPFRLHLRVEHGDRSILIVNAATVLHLNPTATAHALQLVQGATEEDAAAAIAQRYNVSRKQARDDHTALREKILTLATNPDVDPVLYLNLERARPYEGTPTAPYRIDLALTYATDPDGKYDPLVRERVDQELSTAEWKQILDHSWDAGIPHVTFTGGEPTRREDLLDLIRHAEQLGQVTGLITEGRKLADPAFVRELQKAGLDHFLIVHLPDVPANLEGIKNALASDVYTAIHLTLDPESVPEFETHLSRLRDLGVPAVSLSAPSTEGALGEALTQASDFATNIGLQLLWDLPAPYSVNHPIAIEIEEAQPQGAGRAWLYVEPDGDVLPAQGINDVLGNMLTDPWTSIREKAIAG